MRLLYSIVPILGCLCSSTVEAASWGFGDATVSVNGKGGVGSGFKDTLSPSTSLSKSVALGASDTLRLLITTSEDGAGKRPHQAFLTLADQETGLEDAYAFSVKENGKGKVEISQKDIPLQLLSSGKPLIASIILGSFGTAKGFSSHVFDLEIERDPTRPITTLDKPLRYGKLAEINHIFRADSRSGPLVVSLFFLLAVLITVPILFGAWAYLGANLSHINKAITAAPVAHALFYGSIVSMECLFFLYYYSWNLFQVLPVALGLGSVIFLSGTKALSEVQGRRLSGER